MGERREKEEVHAETRMRGETATENGLSGPLDDWKTLHFGDICSRVQETVTPSQSGSRVQLGALTWGYLKTYPIPILSPNEQSNSVAVFSALEARAKLYQRKHATLSDLLSGT